MNLKMKILGSSGGTSLNFFNSYFKKKYGNKKRAFSSFLKYENDVLGVRDF